MAGTSQIDISQLPAPTVVEQVDFDVIVARDVARMQTLMAAAGQVWDAVVESDPIMKFIELKAYGETLLRTRANEAAVAVMLAFAQGPDLDQIGANYKVLRQTITPADPTTIPPTAAVMEKDADYKARIQLSFEGITTAGSEGSYTFHALSASGSVKDVKPVSPSPGVARVVVLAREGNGAPTQALLDAVLAALTAENIRPFTDKVEAVGAAIVDFSVVAELTMLPGPDAELVRATAEAAVIAYVESVRRIGYDVSLSGLYAALHQPGVQSVKLITPTANIVIDDTSAPYCTAVSVTIAGTDV